MKNPKSISMLALATPQQHPHPRLPPPPQRLLLRPDSPLFFLTALVLAFMTSALAPVNAHADEPSLGAAPTSSSSTNRNGSRRIEVRLSMSRAAADALGETRIRRLFDLELDDVGTLAQGTGGPLGDHVAHVWLDVLSPPQVLIEVRFAERPVTRRFIAIEGLSADVSARLVAIAANELVRAQSRPLRPRKEPKPRTPTVKEIELATRRAPAVVWSAGASMAVLPPSSGMLWGPSISLGFRTMGASEHLFARWLMGSTNANSTRWLEVGVAADYRVWLHKSVRLSFGADAALSFLHLGDVRAIEGVSGQLEAWSGRAGGIVGVDVRAFKMGWVGLHIDPGFVLRPVSFQDREDKRGTIQGLWFGFGLTLQIEHLLQGFVPTIQR